MNRPFCVPLVNQPITNGKPIHNHWLTKTKPNVNVNVNINVNVNVSRGEICCFTTHTQQWCCTLTINIALRSHIFDSNGLKL